MRNFKMFLWMFAVFLIQTTVIARFHILGAVPSLVLPYMICVVILENEFRRTWVIAVICAAAAGGLCGRGFVITVLFYVYSAMVIFALRAKPRYVKNFAKAIFYSFFASGVLELLFVFVKTYSVSAAAVWYEILPTAVINTLLCAVVYPLLKKTMYKEEKKKKLLIT